MTCKLQADELKPGDLLYLGKAVLIRQDTADVDESIYLPKKIQTGVKYLVFTTNAPRQLLDNGKQVVMIPTVSGRTTLNKVQEGYNYPVRGRPGSSMLVQAVVDDTATGLLSRDGEALLATVPVVDLQPLQELAIDISDAVLARHSSTPESHSLLDQQICSKQPAPNGLQCKRKRAEGGIRIYADSDWGNALLDAYQTGNFLLPRQVCFFPDPDSKARKEWAAENELVPLGPYTLLCNDEDPVSFLRDQLFDPQREAWCGLHVANMLLHPGSDKITQADLHTHEEYLKSKFDSDGNLSPFQKEGKLVHKHGNITMDFLLSFLTQERGFGQPSPYLPSRNTCNFQDLRAEIKSSPHAREASAMLVRSDNHYFLFRKVIIKGKAHIVFLDSNL